LECGGWNGEREVAGCYRRGGAREESFSATGMGAGRMRLWGSWDGHSICGACGRFFFFFGFHHNIISQFVVRYLTQIYIRPLLSVFLFPFFSVLSYSLLASFRFYLFTSSTFTSGCSLSFLGACGRSWGGRRSIGTMGFMGFSFIFLN
jgi:hypothetical protein